MKVTPPSWDITWDTLGHLACHQTTVAITIFDSRIFDYMKVVDEVGSLLKVTLPSFFIFFAVLFSFLVTSGSCFTTI